MPGQKVLVVDDSWTELTMIVAPLRNSGFDVITAVDGDEAMEKVFRERPTDELGSGLVASEDLKTLQRNALIQQTRAQLASSAPALPSQPTRNGQLRTDGPPAAPPGVVGEQYLIFSLVEREFALKAEHIQGVERLSDITPVPNIASWVNGVINLRGSIASVVDLRAFL